MTNTNTNTTTNTLTLLDTIKCTKTRTGKSNMTSGDAYRVTLSHNKKRCSFTFNDNYKNESTKKDFIYCLLLDARSFEDFPNISDFANEFGYSLNLDYKNTLKVFRACQKQFERLYKLFTPEEVEELQQYYYNY